MFCQNDCSISIKSSSISVNFMSISFASAMLQKSFSGLTRYLSMSSKSLRSTSPKLQKLSKLESPSVFLMCFSKTLQSVYANTMFSASWIWALRAKISFMGVIFGAQLTFVAFFFSDESSAEPVRLLGTIISTCCKSSKVLLIYSCTESMKCFIVLWLLKLG